MTALRVGVVGIGFGQQVHVPAFRCDLRCEVTAIAASNLERARDVAARLSIPGSYGDWRALVDDPAIDIVTIAVRPSLQPEIIEAAATSGKHVFCEKPLAISLDAARRAQSAVEQGRVIAVVDFLFSRIPCWEQAKSILNAGSLGAIRHVAISWRVETRASLVGAKASWKSQTSEGGALLGFLPHVIHCLEWLVGEIRGVVARLEPQEGVDRRVSASLVLASGATASIDVATDAFLGSGHRIDVHGENGTLVIENGTTDYVKGFRLRTGTRESGVLADVHVEPLPAEADGRLAPAKVLAREFLDAVRGSPPRAPGIAAGVRVQAVIEAIQRSSKDGKWVLT